MLRAALAVAALLVICSLTGLAQQVVINELYNSSATTDEWVELVVVQDSLDMRGWDLRDFSSGGAAQAPLVFSNDALWSSVRKGTIIVVGQALAFVEDVDASDGVVQIRSNNALYFSGTVFTFAGTSDAIQIRNAADTHIFGVSWGTGNAASLPSPKVHFTGTMSSGSTIFFNEDTLPELTTTTNWTFNTTAQTRGAGNTALNIAWISSLRGTNTGDGSGIATIDPDTTTHGSTFTLNVLYHRDTIYTVTDLRIIIPPSFAWSHSASDVSFTDMTATKSVSGDTVYFSGITFTLDSVTISIAGLTAPDSTAYYPVRIQTRASVQYASLTPGPQFTNFGLPQTIAEIKGNDGNGVALRSGQLVTIRGVMTVANEFGGPSYLQDNTGGIAVFGSALSASTVVGDEVIVSGKVEPFNGLCELTSPYLHSIPTTGNSPTPILLTCNQVFTDGSGGVENYEGMLVRFNLVTVADTFGNSISSWAVTGSGTNYRLFDASGYVDVRIDNGVDFVNTASPQSAFDIIGVVSQFKSSLPFIGGYQVMPRSSADILAQGPIITTFPYETDITPVSVRINWATAANGTSRLRYGTTESYELGVIEPDNVERTDHHVDITGLTAGTIYHVQAFSVAAGDSSIAGDLVMSTASPAEATGTINVYFNKSVNTTVSTGENALGNEDLVSRILTRINNAHRSIDAAIYSLSGSSQGDAIAAALVAAKNRGVKVRIIREYDNTSAAFTTLSGSGIPVIDDRFDAVWFGAGLMHNKFFVIDYRGGAPESVWVWTGSWNPTIQGTTSDRQNSIEFQDVSLAGAYTMEFQEMWGSNTETPNASASRFGARKQDNTPHKFIINGAPVESYFSPSDRTTSHICATIDKAQQGVGVSILTLTRKDIADSIIARKNEGKKARVIMDNNTDLGNQYSYLQTAGVDVHLAGGSGLLHHKYAIIDAENTGATQYTLTGSHNWSNSAENSNDENIVIVRNNRVTNLYLQEFAARYYEAGGTDSIGVSSAAVFGVAPSTIGFGSVTIPTSRQDSFVVSNTGNAVMNVTSVTSTNPRFTVLPASAVIGGPGSQTFVVTFTPNAVGSESGSIVLTHDASGSPDTVQVNGSGVTGGGVNASVTVRQLWNLVSSPVDAPDPRKTTLFPTAVSNAFAYEGTYNTKDTIVTGTGYWLKFPSDTTLTLSGLPLVAETVAVADGWNLIGSVTTPISNGSIVQSPSSIVSSLYYGYLGAYASADSLMPGRGYWVKVNQPGSLILTSAPVAQPRSVVTEVAFPNRLIVTDALGNSQTLSFGATENAEVSSARFELPPVPPQGAFDARFASQKCAQVLPADVRTLTDYPVDIQAGAYPVTVEWVTDAQSHLHYAIVVNNAGVERIHPLSAGGSVRLEDVPGQEVRLRVSSSPVVPETYALGQNYPNPFNPTTTFVFSLPQESRVTLRLFNVLGQEIRSLFGDETMGAGSYSTVFDAGDLASGMYYYEITATAIADRSVTFREIRKCLLVR
jgi:phosphatidylserine/phosphatidylglycerophosphate/cardiolipin synthase-like enzyme